MTEHTISQADNSDKTTYREIEVPTGPVSDETGIKPESEAVAKEAKTDVIDPIAQGAWQKKVDQSFGTPGALFPDHSAEEDAGELKKVVSISKKEEVIVKSAGEEQGETEVTKTEVLETKVENFAPPAGPVDAFFDGPIKNEKKEAEAAKEIKTEKTVETIKTLTPQSAVTHQHDDRKTEVYGDRSKFEQRRGEKKGQFYPTLKDKLDAEEKLRKDAEAKLAVEEGLRKEAEKKQAEAATKSKNMIADAQAREKQEHDKSEELNADVVRLTSEKKKKEERIEALETRLQNAEKSPPPPQAPLPKPYDWSALIGRSVTAAIVVIGLLVLVYLVPKAYRMATTESVVAAEKKREEEKPKSAVAKEKEKDPVLPLPVVVKTGIILKGSVEEAIARSEAAYKLADEQEVIHQGAEVLKKAQPGEEADIADHKKFLDQQDKAFEAIMATRKTLK